MDKSIEEIKALLSRFCERLREVNFPEDADGPILSLFVINSLTAYLNGEAESLDKAFGLKRGRGRPKATDAHLDVARKLFALKMQGKSWTDIMDNPPIAADERTLRDIYYSNQTAVWSEELCRRLGKNDG